MGPDRRVRLSWHHGLVALVLAVAALYVVRYHASGSPLLLSLLMPPAALSLCFAAVAILVPVATGKAWVLYRPREPKTWRLHALLGLVLLWATFAVPALLPAGSPGVAKLLVVFVSFALLLAAAFRLVCTITPLLDTP